MMQPVQRSRRSWKWVGYVVAGVCFLGMWLATRMPRHSATSTDPSIGSGWQLSASPVQGATLTPSPMATLTPIPDWGATQAVKIGEINGLEERIQSLQAEINTLEQTRQDALDDVTLEQARIELGLLQEALAQEQVKSTGVALRETEIWAETATPLAIAAQRMEDDLAHQKEMDLLWQRLLGAAGWFLVGMFCLTVGWITVLALARITPQRNNPVVEEVDLRVQEDGGRRQFLGRPVDARAFRIWARSALGGVSLAINEWTGENKPFGRQEYEELRSTLIRSGVLVWLNEANPNQGVAVTDRGRSALREWLEASL